MWAGLITGAPDTYLIQWLCHGTTRCIARCAIAMLWARAIHRRSENLPKNFNLGRLPWNQSLSLGLWWIPLVALSHGSYPKYFLNDCRWVKWDYLCMHLLHPMIYSRRCSMTNQQTLDLSFARSLCELAVSKVCLGDTGPSCLRVRRKASQSDCWTCLLHGSWLDGRYVHITPVNSGETHSAQG